MVFELGESQVNRPCFPSENPLVPRFAPLSSKCIVEFAKAKHEVDGMSYEEAALTSARLRFRPILMTAFAFILGVIPLMKASGAGSGAQNVMGTGVFFGMLVATFLGVFIIPGNYTFIEQLGRKRKQALAAPPLAGPPTDHGEPIPAPAGGGH